MTVDTPSQPMLAKPCSSVEQLMGAVRRAAAAALIAPQSSSAPSESDASCDSITVAAEHKYDGQRAQIHRLADGTVRLFSRKLDDMSSK